MAYPSKIVDLAEVRTWFEEGRPYRWMSEQYLQKYNIEITPTAFSNLARLHGWGYRYAYGPERENLIPWDVLKEHRHGDGPYVHLLYLIRMQAGKPVPENRRLSTQHFWDDLQSRGLVMDYTPKLGFFAVPRREGIDGRYIRNPDPEPVKETADCLD